MGRTADSPKKHVISFRVDDLEWKLLKKASRRTGHDISTLLRTCISAALRDDRP